VARTKQLVREPAVATTQLTVLDVMRLAFPRGYVDHDFYKGRLAALKASRSYRGKLEKEFEAPLATAVDLFANTDLLLLRSGAYHHVVSDDPTSAAPRTTVWMVGWDEALYGTEPSGSNMICCREARPRTKMSIRRGCQEHGYWAAHPSPIPCQGE
jgi:hypothetical protein